MKLVIRSLVILIFTTGLLSCSFSRSGKELPSALKNRSSHFEQNSNIIFIGTFDVGRSPCEFLPDGSHRWMRTTGFKVEEVIRGKVQTSYVEVHLNDFVGNDPIPLEEGQKYYVLIAADDDLQKRLQKTEPLYFKEALGDETVIAVVDLNGNVKAAGHHIQAAQ